MLVVMKTRICPFIMKLLVLLSTLATVHAGITKREAVELTGTCDGILVNGVEHNKEALVTNLDRPYLLTTDYSSNTLYFSYSMKGDSEKFKSAKIYLNSKEFSDIEGVNNGFAQAVDEANDEVYIGGSDGIYKYKANSNKVEFYGANGTDIWTLYHKNQSLYFSSFPSQFLFTIVNGEITRFKDLEDTMVDNFVIDNKDYLFYTNSSGLYSQKIGTKKAIKFAGEEFRSRGLTTNKNGDVYACTQNGIYFVDKVNENVQKYIEIEDAFGVAFDNRNHIVYADATSVVRLTPCK